MLRPCAVVLTVALFSPLLHAQPTLAPAVKRAEVVVSPSQFGVADRRSASTVSPISTELETLPQIGDDLFRSIARLPGLAGDDFTASFRVQGAPNSQILAHLDGVQLVEPFHLKDVDGAPSIIDPRTISRLELAILMAPQVLRLPSESMFPNAV